MTRRGGWICAIAVATIGIVPVSAPANAAERDRSIAPYIEIGQVVTADLTTDDVLTYSTLAAGVEASLQTRRTQAQVSYRYERRLSYDKRVGDNTIHSGLARGAIRLVPGVSFDGGAIATRVRSDIRGAAPGNLAGNVDNIAQLYSGYLGPTLASHVGPVGVGASYRYGFTKADAPGRTGVPAGSAALDVFDTAQSHVFAAQAGVKPGRVLPVGLTVSGAYEIDTASQLDQRYESTLGRADAVLPVLLSVAITAGAGYEKIIVTQKDPLRDAAGAPVVDGRGRFVTDAAAAPRIAYETDGLIYDGGVIWRPSPRTSLQARVGRRYGGMTYSGSFSYAASRSIGMQIAVYDSVDTFARQLRQGLAGLPTSFIDQRDVFGQQFSGCTFGATSGAAGGCLNGVFQSIATAAYRARGIDGVLSARHGALNFGVGAGFATRRFLAPAGTGFSIDGVTDESVYAQAFLAAPIDRSSGINGTIFANYYESGLSAAPGVFGTGATGLYFHNFGRIAAQATAGIYAFNQKGIDDQLSAQAQLGMRYHF
ncbi:hypothetical protein [Sphingomonas sp. CARO-RG-8B-R24-01]|uniref:hypothetical protein n=1 Tax=Sphingomonas sp. CARO-RG-8B-R24-01 TaxID=2914831 RepID=UPI001F5745E2|nr:hypothetical protein [Sphingomonas sp. CARO-RG-8B-R24-01]